jgi:hypothetical protein
MLSKDREDVVGRQLDIGEWNCCPNEHHQESQLREREEQQIPEYLGVCPWFHLFDISGSHFKTFS